MDYQTKQKMKATLTFNLPEEQIEYNYTLNAARYKDALKDIMDLMRREYKYGEHVEEVSDKIADLYDRFIEITEGLLDE
jgi:cobalamin biosynthesis protein CobT